MISINKHISEKIYTADDWIRSIKELENGTIIIAGDFNKIVILNPVYNGESHQDLEYVEGESFDLNTIKFSADMDFTQEQGMQVKKVEVTPD